MGSGIGNFDELFDTSITYDKGVRRFFVYKFSHTTY